MLSTYNSTRSTIQPSPVNEIITTTPAIINQISTINEKNTVPYSQQPLESLISPSLSPASTSFGIHVTPSSSSPACFTLQPRIKGLSNINGKQHIERLFKLNTFTDSIFRLTTEMAGSTNPLVIQYKDCLLNFKAENDNIIKSINKKAKETYKINKATLKKLSKTINNKSIGEFIQKILAIHQAKTSKVFARYFSQIDMFMTVYEKEKNNTEKIKSLWRAIIDEGDNPLRDFLVGFNLWDYFRDNVNHMLEANDDDNFPDFIARQYQLYDELKTLCAPSTPSQEENNLYRHQFCDLHLNDKSVAAAIESMQENKGLTFVLSCTDHGKQLLEQLNNYKVLLAQDTRTKREKQIEAELATIAPERATSKKTSLLKALFNSIPICINLLDSTDDLRSELRASRNWGLDISASVDSGLKSIYDTAYSGVRKSLTTLLKNEKILNEVVSAIGITPEVKAVTPQFMTEELSVSEALCVANTLYNNRVIADNMGNLTQLYHVMREKFLHPDMIQELTFNQLDHEGHVVIKALLLAALQNCIADPEMDWMAQWHILLGFADKKHAENTDATEQTVMMHDNHKIRHFVKLDHFDTILEYVSNRINKEKLRWKFKQSIKLDLKIIKLINQNITTEDLQLISSDMINYLLCDGCFSDADLRPFTFRTKLASLLKVAPQKFLSDMAEINYTPSYHFRHHAHQTDNLFTAKQISNVDHLVVIIQYLQEVVAETTTTLEHLESVEYIVRFADLNGFSDAEQNTLKEEFIKQKNRLNQQPYNIELKEKLKELAKTILENVELNSLIEEDNDEPLNEIIPLLDNYFSSYQAKDINKFYAKMQEMGLPLNSDSQEKTTQFLSEMLNDGKEHPNYHSEVISAIVHELFSSLPLSDPAATSQSVQVATPFNTLSTQLLAQMDIILNDEIKKSIDFFNPEHDQAAFNLLALCQIIDNPDAIEKALKEYISKPNEKNTHTRKLRLTPDQFKLLKHGLYNLFKSGSSDYASDIEKLFDKMKELAKESSERYAIYIYDLYMKFKKVFSDKEGKTPSQLFFEIQELDQEKGIPSLIKMEPDVIKRTTARLSKETFILGDMNAASHADFLHALNRRHQLSPSLYFKFFRLKPWLSFVSKIRDDEIECNQKRIEALNFSLNASTINAAIQAGVLLTEHERQRALYREKCEREDAIRDQRQIEYRNDRDLWNQQMTLESNIFLQHVMDFSREFMFWWQPRYIVYKTIVRDGHKSIIIFSNDEFFQSEHSHEYDIGLTMIRTKNVDILDDKKRPDQNKILKTIKKTNPDFKFVNTQRIRTEVNHNIRVNIVKNGEVESKHVATLTQTHTLSTEIVINTITADFMHAIPSVYPTSNNDKLSYHEFFFQPDTLRDIHPVVAESVYKEKQTFLPPYVADPKPSTSAAATAMIPAANTARSCNPIDNQLREMVSPFTRFRPENVSLPEPFLSSLQERTLEHLALTIGRDIVTINNKNEVTYYYSGGNIVSYNLKLEISANDAKRGNYAAALPDKIIEDVHKREVILLKVDGQKYNGIQVQSTDAGFVSSMIPNQPDYRDSVINSTLHKLVEPVRPLVEEMFPAVMNAAYVTTHGTVPDGNITTYPLVRKFLEQLNHTAEQESEEDNQPGTSGSGSH
ncbi:hypothetical protein [Pantoea phytobeneficialis]|uniref:Uncharacterized protein n=1 Tax=Pantoea phytobeneficialis TaxID=2052056 RepID=A0ABT8XNF2_9GAMM|nr:hypothetical protein [Pantoea phytobeneficialis]MDO6404983.1 hypothetical protein [Pantoea phytobeneficialis]